MTNVLIVDDEKIEREGLKYLLSREEGERKVFEASNGKQALQIIRTAAEKLAEWRWREWRLRAQKN